MALDGIEIDRLPAQLLVPRVERLHVAVPDDGVALSPCREIHHRIADVSDLDVEHGEHTFAIVMELTRVPHDDRLAALRIGRIAPQPRQTELEERIGHLRVRTPDPFIASESERSRLGWIRRPEHPGIHEGTGRQRVQSGEDLQVVIDDGNTLCVGTTLEVVAPADAVHHVGARFVDPPVHGGDGDAVLGHGRLQPHLVVEGEHELHVGAIAANDQFEGLAVAFDVDEPHGTPTSLTGDVGDPTTDVRLDPPHDEVVALLGDPDHDAPPCRPTPAIVVVAVRP